MKILNKSFVSRVRLFLCALFAFFLLAGFVVQSEATVYTLTDGDSSAKVDDTSGGGRAYDWTVGGVNQLNLQWFYYRIGSSGPEQAIDSIGAPTSVFDPSGTVLTTTYANAIISVQVKFSLSDTLNTGESHLNEDITVNNLSGTLMNLNFFQYSDYDLGGDSADQSVLFQIISGKYRKVIQTDGTRSITETVTPSIGTTVRVEAATDGSTLANLTDGDADNLNNSASAGPGNITYAFQWTNTIAVGGSLQLSKLQTVPEPSSLALISSGIFVLAWLHRRRRGV